MGSLYDEYITLQYRFKAQKQELQEFRTGKRYMKLQDDYRRIIAGYQRENNKLRRELADEKAHVIDVRKRGFEDADQLMEEHKKNYRKMEKELDWADKRYWKLQRETDRKIEKLKEEHQKEIEKKDALIQELTEKLERAEARLRHDSSNTGTPTSKTPEEKEKRIPNSRRGSGLSKGGQPGHEKHDLEPPKEEEITTVLERKITDEVCWNCASQDFTETEEYDEEDDKYEYDLEISLVKRKIKYRLFRCNACGNLVKARYMPEQHGKCHYGSTVKSMILSLINTANASINKVPVMIAGMTGGEIRPSEGYVAKLQKKSAQKLDAFRDDLRMRVIGLHTVYWDDTVVMADKKRICMRFYGDEKIAYYVAHDGKGMDGILQDGILSALQEETRVMHDHYSVNYNSKFIFKNLECIAHLERDLQKNADDTGHTEYLEIKELISNAIKFRNDLENKGKSEYPKGYVDRINKKLDKLLDEAEIKAENNKSRYSGPNERALIKRIRTYRDNYFAWMKDFTLPTTNNLSERALRGIKTKMKVSGQFASTTTADYYAALRTYIETCRRNGINEFEALTRLCDGNPYTVEEIFGGE